MGASFVVRRHAHRHLRDIMILELAAGDRSMLASDDCESATVTLTSSSRSR